MIAYACSSGCWPSSLFNLPNAPLPSPGLTYSSHLRTQLVHPVSTPGAPPSLRLLGYTGDKQKLARGHANVGTNLELQIIFDDSQVSDSKKFVFLYLK